MRAKIIPMLIAILVVVSCSPEIKTKEEFESLFNEAFLAKDVDLIMGMHCTEGVSEAKDTYDRMLWESTLLDETFSEKLIKTEITEYDESNDPLDYEEAKEKGKTFKQTPLYRFYYETKGDTTAKKVMRTIGKEDNSLCFMQSVPIEKNNDPSLDPYWVYVYDLQARRKQREGDTKGSEKLMLKALRQSEEINGSLHRTTITMVTKLAKMYRRESAYEESIAFYKDALHRIMETKDLTENSRNSKMCRQLKGYASVLKKSGNEEESVAAIDKSQPYCIKRDEQFNEYKRIYGNPSDEMLTEEYYSTLISTGSYEEIHGYLRNVFTLGEPAAKYAALLSLAHETEKEATVTSYSYRSGALKRKIAGVFLVVVRVSEKKNTIESTSSSGYAK